MDSNIVIPIDDVNRQTSIGIPDNSVMSTFGERLREARKDAKMSQATLALKVGLKQPTIAELEAEGKGSSKSALIAQVLGVSAVWLSDGVGEKHALMAEQPLQPYQLEANFLQRDIRITSVPKISWVKAGAYTDVIDFLEPGDAQDWLPCPTKHGPKTFALQVDGSSMDSGNPDGYPDGYDIFVDPDVEPKHGDDVVVRTPDGQATFKRLQINSEGQFLLALNPNWPNRIIKAPEGTVICGVVIYAGRPRR